MFSKISERSMHLTRWVLTCGWLLLIASLFYDPVSQFVTAPDQLWSPFRIKPDECILVQTKCLELKPYPLGAPIFWGIIVPSSIFILLVFGHELWRRICPLSFLSQIPRALGIQRQIKRVDSKGKTRYEIPKVKPNSWLGKNYLYLQFGLLFIGLCLRILFINGDRLALGIWLLLTIASAIFVGYWYGGKTWCNYFCPMSPVQKIYAEPRALLASKAHMSDTMITQSMCRTIVDGKEQSACIACQNPCIDIDSERSYWDGIEKPESKFLYYCYLGLVVGYFFYYYLYAGNWDYYYSGAWAMEGNSLDKLLSPGFYVYGNSINIPKLLAVPLTLASFTALGYVFGNLAERIYRSYLQLKQKKYDVSLIRHHLFSLCTFIAFNLFFIFGGRPFIRLMPNFFQETIDVIVVLLSTLWLYHSLKRSPELYSREGLLGRFRKQLLKMDFPLHQYFPEKDINELNPHEVYVLAKVLPGFTKQKRGEAYKGVLREALEEGYVDSVNSLEVLRHLRTELDISDSEHRSFLEELGVEDPLLLDPNHKRTLENTIRISGYRKALERLVKLQKLNNNDKAKVAQTYCITPQEEAEILQDFDRNGSNKQKALFYLDRLQSLIYSYHCLHQSVLQENRLVIKLLLEVIRRRKQKFIVGILQTIETLGENEAQEIAKTLGGLAPNVLQDILEQQNSEWHERLNPEIIKFLHQPSNDSYCNLQIGIGEIEATLVNLLKEPNPIIQAASLFTLQKLDCNFALTSLPNIIGNHQILQEMINYLFSCRKQGDLKDFPLLEKVVYLYNSDFFEKMDNETLLALADRAVIKTFEVDSHLTDEGDTCRELLVLIEGIVEITKKKTDGSLITSTLLPGKVLDELEVITHSALKATIVAKASPTRVLAIPVDTFDEMIDGNHYLALKVLELETNILKGLLQ
ncbi:MAG: cyclic nucleotide-binding protein [Cyanobacteria bacterium M5B4]|nr:MAG: cyclic nucleotide-binding protein [Cyanobacteria bacterium M5B4]